MSNQFSIAAVTLTLHSLLDKIENIDQTAGFAQLPVSLRPQHGVEVTSLPLEKACEYKKDTNQVNLFLYHVEHSAAWRNMDIPGSVKQGETGSTPLALNLYYILTAYGEGGSELIGHLLMGEAMSIMHDHTLLGREELKAVCEISGLHKQVERLRIRPQPISLDEVAKLWTGFQTQYRLAAAYEVAVLLIESNRPARTPLPVLTRGGKDALGNEKGIIVQANLIPPYPTLETITFPDTQTGALLADPLTVTGHHLDGAGVTVCFGHGHLEDALEVTLSAGDWTDKQLSVGIPDQPALWPAGFYTMTARLTDAGGNERTSNGLSFMIMPTITAPISIAPESSPVGFRATVTCSPQVLPEQRASLLLGDREIMADDHSTGKNDTLTFLLTDVAPGDIFYVRLRIDGVDSPIIDRDKEPPEFLAGCEVTIP